MCNGGAAGTMSDVQIPTDPYHIQAASSAASIPKLVLKHQESFFVADRAGDFPAHFDGELGFYHEGTRHLRWLELRLHGDRPLILSAEGSPANDRILIGLANADLPTDDGPIPRNSIYIDRLVTLRAPHLVQALTISSYHDRRCVVTLEILFAADFRDVFEVRGMHRAQRGELLPERREGGHVRLAYHGRDDVVRFTDVRFEPAPHTIASNRAVYTLTLEPGAAQRVDVTVSASTRDEPPSAAIAARTLRASAYGLAAESARVKTDNEVFSAFLQQSVADVQMLLTDTPEGPVPYAGVPWYVAPFGRDSIITALQLLPYHAHVAAGTLRFLAARQGRAHDAFKDEEPGKILHELRLGEMANCREIPFIPYYGTIDATPLFVVLLTEYVRWTGDLALARELWPAAQAALAWMRDSGDRDGDGYLEYATQSSLGLANQGWKDSEDSVSHASGALADAPIALAEVQGYAYAALAGAAELADALGDREEAERRRREAAALFERFNRDFWLPQEEFYALALDGDKRPCAVVASNAGHCLWSGIVPEPRAPAVAKRLLADDMYTGWGIRTLSARARRYNPMSYHNGSVWPHDNAIAAAGLRRYRLGSLALTVATGLFEASRHFGQSRLPELFCGFTRRPGHGPISYPVACSPQAWAAGSGLQLLTTMLGLEADALAGRLTLVSPQLPPWLRDVEIYDLRVGSSSLDVAIGRGRDGAAVELIGRRGDVELIVRR
jgi:glycogen debranching enzyme